MKFTSFSPLSKPLFESMENTNRLFENKDYQSYLNRIHFHEKNRAFCKHNLSHFLDVARIATIKSREAPLSLTRDLIYTTALLHDIGRFQQYEDKTPHEIASHKLATGLIQTLDFSGDEKKIILEAIINHRNPNTEGFNRIFYESDKLSRSCFGCIEEQNCHWSKEKKNLKINY
ncbi:MAG: HD domain-containing protein [Eubacteriaceae bacterium]